jgi:glycosyltransferase involved in cell wall biosynthesis
LKAIFAISQKGIDYALATWKIPNKSVFKLARLGVNKQIRCEMNKNRFILVSCSNVIPLKRVDLIVQALAEIKEYPITWVHFGDGPQLEEVKALAQEILPPNITVDFKGRVPNQEILTWYAENNPSLFINVSTTEGIPVSIMEAMSFGIPVIATNVGGTSEIVNDENGKLLLPNPDPIKVTFEINKFFNLDVDLFRQFSSSAFSKWDEIYNSSINFEEFVKKLKE